MRPSLKAVPDAHTSCIELRLGTAGPKREKSLRLRSCKSRPYDLRRVPAVRNGRGRNLLSLTERRRLRKDRKSYCFLFEGFPENSSA
ncbi:hypothetical protein BQ8482_440025 [Mesorhizobium delmotii]|uniref:Uncharacterized protein n=1 Tax=Mesorhizobium delmotii TaxID=1631247 RepID=A0A2P9ATG9_9HYPH|nr:hypothetical protein BQ8482_440025 [Mesorhizobium delmotii]